MARPGLLPRAQLETLQCLESWPSEAPGPSYRDLMEALGLKSTAPVQERLARLASRGLITWRPGVPRSIRVSPDIRVLRPGCHWVSVPTDRAALVEDIAQADDPATALERALRELRQQRKAEAAANYDGVAPL